jgi:hypothetical protein
MRNAYLDKFDNIVMIDDVAEFNERIKSKPVFCACGMGIPNTQILKSAAGYYIGTAYYDEEIEGWFPDNRKSEGYWSYIGDAIDALVARQQVTSLNH